MKLRYFPHDGQRINGKKKWWYWTYYYLPAHRYAYLGTPIGGFKLEL